MTKNRIFVVLLCVLAVSAMFSPAAFSQDFVTISAGVPSVNSPEEKLQALETTRFHFITLKQFHSALFTLDRKKTKVPEKEAYILNTALNAFLTRAGRETILLDALRQDRAVRLRFSVPERTNEYQMIDNPDKPLAYQLEPVVKSVPATIEIKPVLDEPVAFKITLRKGNDNYVYDIDWNGQIICITCLNNPVLAG